jgi:hypothetical protein
MDGYLTKPLDLQKLTAELEFVLAGTHTADPIARPVIS